jgi:hypothetical protein
MMPQCVQPIEHDIVEQMIAAEDIFRMAIAIGPAVEFLDDPAHLADRRLSVSP